MKIKEKKKDGGHMSWFLRGRKIDKKKKLVAVVYSKARSIFFVPAKCGKH